MKLFYTFLSIIFLSITAQAQLAKPLYPPTKSKGEIKQNLAPLKASLKGIPNARTSIISSFSPKTFPASQRRLNKAAGLKIVERSKTGNPIMIKGTLRNAPAGRDLSLQVQDYLEAIKIPIQIKAPSEEFVLMNRQSDDLGHVHFKLQQYHKGIKVYGGQIWLHAKQNQVHLFNGRNHPTPKLSNLQPSFDKEQATAIAYESVGQHTTVKKLSDFEKKAIGEMKEPELVVYHKEGNPTPFLAWHLHLYPNIVKQWEYFVDAHSGEILDAYATLCQLYHDVNEKGHERCNHATPAKSKSQFSINKKIKDQVAFLPENGPATAIARDLNNVNQTVNSYEINGNYFLIDASRQMFSSTRSRLPNEPVGAIWTIDAQNTYPENNNFVQSHVVTNSNNWTDGLPVSAHHNAGVAYEYFANTFGRNSINGKGGTIISFINVSDEDGSSLANAFWIGAAMMYGNGGNEFEPLAKSLDVAGHEMSHGVIQNTANLRYQGQSGAMNESFADVFGVLIENEDFRIGEDVVNQNIFRSGALRNMQDPHNGGTRLGDPGWQPDHISEYWPDPQNRDNGGVHINSGIINKAFFLIANNLGATKAQNIYFRALTTYLVNTSQFVDLRVSLIQSATDLHGAGSNEIGVIANAFDQVGIAGATTGSGDQSGGAVEVEINPSTGDDFVVYTDDAQANLYLADGEGNIVISPFTDSGILSRPSITDDGSAIVFIAADKTLHAIFIDWENEGDAEEVVLDDTPKYRNVAVSRDGFRIAALLDERTNEIQVYDFTLEAWKVFELYNPTFAEGISTGEVQFADVIEFDFSGEYVLYDAFNSISGTFGAENIEYWDIGFLKVYENDIDNFEQNVNNNIEKLFSGLAENVSVGNPTFSKNSPNILAYEYIDEFDVTDDNRQIYEMRGFNITTGEEEVIFRNIVLNVPSFGRLDDRLIFNAQINEGTENVVAVIGLADDKISPSGGASVLVSQTPGAQLGVWFSDGSRQLTTTNELEKSVFDLQIAPNPFNESFSLAFTLEERKDLILEVYNTLGQRQMSQTLSGNVGHNQQLIETGQLASGTYIISLKSEEGVVSRKIVK